MLDFSRRHAPHGGWRSLGADTVNQPMDLLFPFLESWWLFAGFAAFVLMLLALDLGVFHRHANLVSFRESLACVGGAHLSGDEGHHLCR